MLRAPPTLAVVVTQRTSTFEFAIPLEVFGTDRSVIAAPWYAVTLCAGEEQPLRTEHGLVLDGLPGLEVLDTADTVVVPAWRDDDEIPPAPLLAALHRAADRGARLVSLCTGAFVLAAAGVLDGRAATTHWLSTATLAARYPQVRVDPGVLYVEDGQVLTSAGSGAAMDLCLHLVRLDYGAEVANAVARRLVVPPHRDGGQAQFIDQPVPPASTDDARVARSMDWALERLDEQLDVERLARQALMSPRSYARHFRAVAGTTPYHWVLGQRLLLARRLLETSDLSVELVAADAGLGSAASLRQHFRRELDTSPDAYRRTFRARRAG